MKVITVLLSGKAQVSHTFIGSSSNTFVAFQDEALHLDNILRKESKTLKKLGSVMTLDTHTVQSVLQAKPFIR